MTLTLSPLTHTLVRDALAKAGTRASNRIADDTMRSDVRARVALRDRDPHAHTLHVTTVPREYEDSIAAAHAQSRILRDMEAQWRAHVSGTPGDNTHDATPGIGFMPSDERSRTLALAISGQRKITTDAYAIPLHHSDLYATATNRFLRSIHYHSHAVEWAGVDAEDILQSAYAACLTQGALTVGAMYRAVKLAARNERAFAFATRGGGMVSIDSLDAWQVESAVALDRLATYGRAVIAPSEYGDNTPEALAFDPTLHRLATYGNAPTIDDHRDAVMDAAREREERIAQAEAAIDARRASLTARASEEDGLAVAATALLVEGNTLEDIAEYLGVVTATVVEYVKRLLPASHPIGRDCQPTPTYVRQSVVNA